jgi:hypothetical protein
MRYLQEVKEVRLARPANLRAMPFRGDLISTANKPGIFGGAVLTELGEKFLEASVQLALGAVPVETKRNVPCRRHVLVYAR